MLYHALYCVRVATHDEPIRPVLLAGAARGSHAARKHLVVAYAIRVRLQMSHIAHPVP